MINTIIRRYNYFEQNLLEHAMIGYLDYMSMTVRNQRWTRSKYFRIGCQKQETIVDRSLVFHCIVRYSLVAWRK